jgi:hypothetical protein
VIEEAMREERACEKADGENGEGDLEKEEPRLARHAGEGDPGFVDEEMDEKKNGLNDGNGYGDSRVQARTPCRPHDRRSMLIRCVGEGFGYVVVGQRPVPRMTPQTQEHSEESLCHEELRETQEHRLKPVLLGPI